VLWPEAERLMKIAISTLVTPAKKAGVGNYIVRLIEALQETDPENEYYIFIGRDTKALFKLSRPNFCPVYLPFSHDPRWLMRPLYYLWQNSLIWRYLERYDVDVLHLPNLLPVLVTFVPTVVTIPDLAEHRVSKYTKVRQAYRKALPRIVARKATRIIAISHSTKQDLITLAGVPADIIDVTYLASGIAPSTAPGADVMDKYGIKSQYILYVGSMLPHKNLERVVKAFALLRRQRHIQYHLVLVGDNDKSVAFLRNLARELGIENQIILVGYVSDLELAILYREARLFVFPSIHEGFGLPVLEAMTCGTPVVTSNVSSLPEVAGEAAVLVDPFSVESISNGIWSVLSDENKMRVMALEGKKQARRFTWDECARGTVASYRLAAKALKGNS